MNVVREWWNRPREYLFHFPWRTEFT